jgi:hypothetical protein
VARGRQVGKPYPFDPRYPWFTLSEVQIEPRKPSLIIPESSARTNWWWGRRSETTDQKDETDEDGWFAGRQVSKPYPSDTRDPWFTPF